MPSLTIGLLLMRIRRLEALTDSLTDAQREQLERIIAAHQAVRKSGRCAIPIVDQEAKSRLKAMDAFFEECEDPRTCPKNYIPETLRRTIVQDINAALSAMGADDSIASFAARTASCVVTSRPPNSSGRRS